MISNQKINIFPVLDDIELSLQFIEKGIKAGFPSPAQDYVESEIDLNKFLIRNKASTFLARVDDDSMYEDNISDGDIIVIDRSLFVNDGDRLVACIDGEFTLKTIKKGDDKVLLIPANPDYNVIEVTPDNELIIWGVVTYIIKKIR